MALEKETNIIQPPSNQTTTSLYHRISHISILYNGHPDPVVASSNRNDTKIYVNALLDSYTTHSQRILSKGGYNNSRMFLFDFPSGTEITRELLYNKIKEDILFSESLDV